MEVIEDVKEYILRFLFAAEELYIVNDEYIHHLVKMTEIVDSVVPHGVDELMREPFRAHIQNSLIRLAILDFQTNRMRKMGFP